MSYTENNINNQEFADEGTSKSPVSAAAHEAVGAMGERNNLKAFAKDTTSALALLDGDNSAPVINGADKNGDKKTASASEKGDKASSPEALAAKHNEDMRNILLNANSILDKHHRDPIESRKLNNGENVATGKQTKENQNGQAGAHEKSAQTEQAKQAEEAKRAEQIKQAELAREQQARQAEIARRLQLESELAGILNEVNAPKEAPKPLHITTVAEAQKAKELAEELKLPLVIDVHADWCGPCRQLDADTMSYLEGRKNDSSKPKVNAVYVHINSDQAEDGIISALHAGQYNSIPYVAVFNPSNYDKPVYKGSGFLSYRQLASYIDKND